MNHLAILLKSGMSFYEALTLLKQSYPKNSQLTIVHQKIQNGEPIAKAMASFYPWWCSYPFHDVSISIKSTIFLDACTSYLNYRKSWVKLAFSELLYPFVMFIISIKLVIIVFQTIGHTIPWASLILALCMAFFCLASGSFFFLFYRLFSISTLDILQVCKLCFFQGWSLNTIFNSITFSGQSKKKWNQVKLDSIKKESFIQAFSFHFKLPTSIKESLLIHEKAGQLSSGFELAVPLLQEISFKQFRHNCQIIKLILYGFILIFILIVIYIIYIPIINNEVMPL